MDIGCTSAVKHHIRLSDDSAFRVKSRGITPADYADVRKHLADLMGKGIIRPSESVRLTNRCCAEEEWGRSAVHRLSLSKQSDGSWPVHHAENRGSSAHLEWSTDFHLFRPQSGYYQIELEEADKAETAFWCPLGFYEFNRMPQGITNAIEKCMGDLNLMEVMVYLDDLLVFSRTMNSHNVREYQPRRQKPVDFDYQRNNDRHNLTVWIGLLGNGSIIGPFRNNINGDEYLHMINEDVVPAINDFRRYRPGRRNAQFRRAWWAQDGAPPHRRRIVTERLAELFGDRINALNRLVEWPPRSPDLTPLDFFLWGHLKSKVYTTPPRDLDDLQERVTAEVAVVRQDTAMIRHAVYDMLRRAEVCVQRNGGHVEDWIVHA